MKSISTRGLSTGTSLKSRVLRSWPLWLAAVFLLIAVGWFSYSSVEESSRERLSEVLSLIVETNTEVLLLWLDGQKSTAEAFASDEVVREAVRELRKIDDLQGDLVQRLMASPQQQELREHLEATLESRGYKGFTVIDSEGVVLSSFREEMIGSNVALDQLDPRADPWALQIVRTLAGASSVSPPYSSRRELPDEQGNLRTGLPAMHAFAPVRDEGGRVLAALGFRINPTEDFTEMLRISRIWRTGETYAFSREGQMLSQSRFDDQLRTIGLLPDDPEVDSILDIEIRDPEGDLTRGFVPSKDRSTQPLTWAVANASAGRNLVDVDGYRDYRGVQVVGAWKWLEEYDFGLVVEVDYAEAYSGLRMLRLAFGVVFGLLALATVVGLAENLVISRLRSKVSRAESRLRQMGQYTLLERLGEGGMGEVYRASHAMLRRPTAIKLLKPDKVDAERVARFEREVQLTSQLTHPNTISVYDYGKTPDGVFYYAMEFLEGITLEDLIETYGPISAARTCFILAQACSSLQEAHDVGLIHRDVKPANVFLCRRGGQWDFVKVLDFGLVSAYGANRDMTRLTQAGTAPGTPAYMAPEIALGEEGGPQADIYSLGCVAYWLMTGQLLFDADTPFGMAMAHTKEEPVAPSKRTSIEIPERFEALILSCLAKAPEDRPQSAEQLAVLLRACDLDDKWGRDEAREWWQHRQMSVRETRTSG